LLVQKNYGKVLKLISEQGAAGFYEGDVADAIVQLQEREGGIITHADLIYAMENYPLIEQPVMGTYRGYDIISATTPSSGGITLIELLNMLEQYVDISELGHNSVEYIHVLATALTLAYGDKRQYIGDSRKADVPIRGLLSKEYAAERWANYKPDRAYLGRFEPSGSDYGNPWKYEPKLSLWDGYSGYDGLESASTTSFSVADKDGNIVSVTQTINYFFGNGYVVPGYGFFMNNELSSFSFNARSVNYIEPYKQPVSHIMPTIIMLDGDPYLTIGSPGSMRIPSAVIQVVVNMIDFGMDIQTAIASPRIYSYALANDNFGIKGRSAGSYLKDIYIERALKESTKEALQAMGYFVIIQGSDDIDLFFGGAQGIHFDKSKEYPLHGGADPRRDGKALGY
jgi:gamma-glutamyltranspeptidase/glutathione hydrolase